MYKARLFFLLIILPILSYSQSFLSIDEAVSIAIKNNFDIMIARNESDIAKLNNTSGNAGMLPNISVNASQTFSFNKTEQKSSGSQDIVSSTNNSSNLNAGIFLGWTLFDGGKMFVTKRKLNEIYALGEIQYKEKIMQTVYNVIAAYFDVVKQKQQLLSINEVINYNQERVKILQTSFDAGLTPKNNLLQAKIDLNVNKENAINQQTVIATSKRTLNLLLCRDPEIDFDVSDSISISTFPDKNEMLKKVGTDNTTLLSLQKQISIYELILKEYKSSRYPKLSFNAGYNFINTDNSSGSILMNRYYGPQIGFSLSIPIFQGGTIERQISVANIQLNSVKNNFETAKISINTQLFNAYNSFENQQKLLGIEKENTQFVKDNLEISLERLRLGQTTALEVRQAQESYESSKTRLINFRYNLKLAETKLKLLMNQL